jgi:hypothetical protein
MFLTIIINLENTQYKYKQLLHIGGLWLNTLIIIHFVYRKIGHRNFLVRNIYQERAYHGTN